MLFKISNLPKLRLLLVSLYRSPCGSVLSILLSALCFSGMLVTQEEAIWEGVSDLEGPEATMDGSTLRQVVVGWRQKAFDLLIQLQREGRNRQQQREEANARIKEVRSSSHTFVNFVPKSSRCPCTCLHLSFRFPLPY